MIFRIGHRKEFQRLRTRALSLPHTFPVNPQRKQKWHIKLGKIRAYTHKKIVNQTNGYRQVSFHGRLYTSYKLRFTLLTFIKYIILQKNWSCWYPIWKISISIVYNVGFSLLLGRICVNEDFYDLLAQVITFHIILKSVIFEKKTKREIATWKFFQARAEFTRTLPDKRAKLSLRRDTDRQGVKERN